MNRITQLRCLAVLTISVLTLGLLPSAIWGQATTGSIAGRVTDPSGSVVSGAHVSIQSQETGILTEATTNDSGEFYLPAMPPNHYKIVIEANGFTTVTEKVFELQIDQKARFNVGLKVGAATTNVVVTDSAPVLQTQGAETGQVVGEREIQDLPLANRDISGLLLLVPGVVTGSGGNNLNLSVNGQREFSNSVEVNGTEVTGNRNNDTNVRPSPDAVQEFKVVTSGYAPEFGRASGGSLIVQTKSGTNNIHGSGYFFDRPPGTASDGPLTAPGDKPTVDRKMYGATIGGPIKKDKAFLFLAYEGHRQTSSSSYLGNTPPVNQVSFDSAGDADLSQLLDPYTGNQVPIFNPYFFNENYYSEQFPGNIIPANMVSNGGRKILENLFPQPQNNTFFTNFAVNQAYIDNGNIANLRSDYTPSQANRVYLTYDAEQGYTAAADPYAGFIPVKNGGSGDSGDLTSFENHVIGLRYDHIFSPSLLNEGGIGWFLSTVNQNSPLHGSDLATQYNIQNVIIPGFPATDNFPQIQFQSGPTVGGSTYKPLTFRDQNWTGTDTISWTVGHHNMKFGYDYRHLNSHPNFSLFPVPYEYVGGAGDAQTSDPTYSFYDGNAYYYNGGSEIADLLLGLPYVVDQGLQLTNASTSSNEHSVYMQDYWQATPKLNITYGFRYEYQQPYVDANDNEANFDIDTLTMQIAGRGPNSRSLVKSNKENFMPRLGAAYQATPSLVIRAGFGIYYSPENDAREDILTKNYPFFTQQQFVNYFDFGYYNFILPYNLDTGIPRATSISVPAGVSSIDMTTVPGSSSQSVYSEPNLFPTAYSRNYNFTIEKAFGATSLEVGYVGANTRHLSDEVGNYNVNNHLSPLIGKVQTLLPVGLSDYKSLQVKLNREFTRGYSILAAYTFALSKDNGPAPFDLGKGGNYPQNPFNVDAEYAASDTDVRHHFSAAQIIELPFGRGRRFLSDAGGVVNAIVGGWQLASITTLQTGRPFNITSNANDPNYPGLRPDLVGVQGTSRPGDLNGSGKDTYRGRCETQLPHWPGIHE
jgi:hypothetical protein